MLKWTVQAGQPPAMEPPPPRFLKQLSYSTVFRLKWHLFRLCHLRKWSNFQGYGFNLHTDRSKVIIIIIIVVVTVVFFVVIVVIIMVIIIMFIIVMFIIVMFIIVMSIIVMSMYRRVSWLGMLIQSLQRMQPGSRREIRLLR